MLSAIVGSISQDLVQFGEESTATWVLICSDDELIRIVGVADWLLYEGPPTPSGSSMMIAKACALAAVYIHEGAPRDLARSRRRLTVPLAQPGSERRPDYHLQECCGRYYGVGDDARMYWGH